MGENLKLFMGEVMIDIDEEAAAKHQQKLMEEKKNEMDELEETIDELEGTMKELKTYLLEFSFLSFFVIAFFLNN